MYLLVHRCCDSICTFDHECDFDKICKDGRCIKDRNVEWECSSGRFETPSLACKKVCKHGSDGQKCKECNAEEYFGQEGGYYFGPDGGFILAKKRCRVGLDFELSMEIKPKNASGILLAIQGRKDYLILQMANNTIYLTADNGRGPITSHFKFTNYDIQIFNGNWHEILGNNFV